MRYRNKEIETTVVGDEIMEESGKLHNGRKDEDEILAEEQPVTTDILNPFVHRLELDTTYDKLKVSVCIAVLQIVYTRLQSDADIYVVPGRIDIGACIRFCEFSICLGER